MRKNNKAQIALFIILALVLGIAALFIYFLSTGQLTDAPSKLFGIPEEITPIKSFVDSCIYEVSIPGVYLLGKQGGHIYDYDTALHTEHSQIAYHLEYNNNIAPTKEFLENELATFIEDSLPTCTQGFESFKDFDFELELITAETIIAQDHIIIKIDYPITASQGDIKTKISKFGIDIPVRLGKILDIKDEILINLQNSDNLDLNYFSSVELEVNILPYGGNDIIYSIKDPLSTIENVSFEFNFAEKTQFTENKAPEVEDIGEMNAYVDSAFYFKIIASDPENDHLIFSDETSLFNINQDGEIFFIPTQADMGIYEIPIIISDGTNEMTKILELTVLE